MRETTAADKGTTGAKSWYVSIEDRERKKGE
jgi:hypothetical protein